MDGYAKVANLMATHPEFAIFRRFTAFTYQDLLYMQAEIIHLEDKLNASVASDTAHADRQYYSKDWWSLSQSEDDEAREQWKIWLELRSKKDKYNDCLLKAWQIAQIEDPRQHDLQFLRDWFARPKQGSFPLLGLDKDAWIEAHGHDLAGLSPRKVFDPFSGWIAEKGLQIYHGLCGKFYKKPSGPEVGAGIYGYEGSSLDIGIRIATTVVASVLPTCSVIVLYVVQSPSIRLGLLVLFCAIFSLALEVMTSARKIEVFAATAAFAAVNVVFLANGPNCS